ncbi:MAG: diaminopimelate epimerase [Candidatus Electronema sp. V4]|uniref:diaminopimelate epimerase n=1 Tax=Candidatus Electronema sp. V4 TaxID=3454756 RepID=UPI0040556946
MNTPNFPIPFVKMSGTGNDFILIDHRQPLIEPDSMSTFAAAVCRRKFSVGADGLILIENSEQADFLWRFFNADGSVAEMCGNGARCAARFAFMQGIAPAKMRFETLAGLIEAEVSGKEVAVKMTEPHDLRLHQTISVNNAPLILHSLNTGVPHAVVFVDNIEEADVCGLGRAIRYHEAFQPAGTNVNFVQKRGETFKVRTYERGVEDETLACGTGSAASAIIAALLGQATSPVEIITSGNDRLTILFSLPEHKTGGAAPIVYNVFLKGPAHAVYQGELTVEALL